ncbi:MAG: MaoC family dehydratase [Pseudorhodoplanes sp.]|nr:MaoC family dehydratase [Pseudorhodoplanes sp.]
MTAPKLHFEDFAPGQIREFGPRVITREEIVAFAAEFDPQPMHLDEEAARHTLLGGLAASGWHSCGLMMRMMCDGFLLNSASMGANAIEEVCWLKPVRPGDSLTLRATVLDTRTSKSRPDLGFVGTLMELRNQSGECVMTLKAALMMGRRQGEAA